MAPAPFAAGLAKPDLSSNDSKVLQALFDAESSPSPASATAQTDESLPPLPHISASELPDLQKREAHAIGSLQNPDISPSLEEINTAISQLSVIITDHPKYASAYLNRAQAHRLLIDIRNKETSSLSSAPSTPTPATQLFSDLADTITLLTPNLPTSPISPLQARLLASAHTHRAYILYKAARIETSAEDRKDTLPQTLQDASNERLEEMASFDFQAGGRYGNPVAKQMAVHTNPYAKMCGAIVKDAMQAEIKQWADSR
ncbi:hypothetical protein LOZ65_000589 [Ophidiomyces ophidiicola]|nr:hypothetical protein LOZ65_000589 [Ophidiomyces ophidiicola]